MSSVKSNELTARSSGKKDKIVVEKGVADELPPGWKKEVKLRSGSATKVDRFYTDPVTRYIFHSLKDVQRYLKTGVVGKLARKPKDSWRVDVVNEDEKSHVSMKEKEEMSETWRNKRQLEDGSEGYQIRSKSIENGKSDSPHRASKRLAGIQIDLSPSTEPKTRRATRLAGIKIDSPLPSPPDTRTSRQATRKALIKIASATSSPEPKTSQLTQQSGIKIDYLATSPPEPKTRHAKRQLGMEINASLPEPKKTRQATRSTEIGDNASLLSLPERIIHKSTRLAGSKIDLPPPSMPNTRTCRQSTARGNNYAAIKNIGKKVEAENNTNKDGGNADVAVILDPIIQEIHEKQESHTILRTTTVKEKFKEIETGPATLPPMSHPTVIPSVTLEKHKSIVVSPPVNNPISQNADSSMNFSLNDLWADPCIEFAVKTLTGAIPFHDLKKADNFATSSPLQVPMHDIWTDPCIEFAVKTLTGVIPVGENDYLQFRHQPVPPANSSNPKTLHDFNLPDVDMNFCQTNVLSKHYETTHTKQHESLVGTVGNGGLQKLGNVVNGSNGQCSRSRFFQ